MPCLTLILASQVLACYTLMSFKTQQHLEKAASALLELLKIEREYVPALVCLSQCYLMLKQAEDTFCRASGR